MKNFTFKKPIQQFVIHTVCVSVCHANSANSNDKFFEIYKLMYKTDDDVQIVFLYFELFLTSVK